MPDHVRADLGSSSSDARTELSEASVSVCRGTPVHRFLQVAQKNHVIVDGVGPSSFVFVLRHSGQGRAADMPITPYSVIDERAIDLPYQALSSTAD
jgi:hypothetical protein